MIGQSSNALPPLPASPPPCPPGEAHDPAVRSTESTALQEQRRMALDAIDDFAYTFDLDGRFTFINKALLDLWGLALEQAVGKNFFDLNYPDALAAKLQRQIQEVIATRQRLVDETPYTSPTGAGGVYQYIFKPVLGDHGQVLAVAGSTRDITALKLSEEALRQSREELREARDVAEAANRAKDRFLAVLSHELRTPLSPVVMTIPALEADAELPDKFREDLAMIRRNIDLEVKLIDDLLDLSRITTGKLVLHLQRVSLHEVLRHAVRNSLGDCAEKDLDIREEFDAREDQMTGDGARLQQVFWNLLRNAIKFTPDDGRIVIRTRNSDDRRHIEVTVQDTGVGIPAEALPRIFDAFEQGDARITRQFGGLGLGLAIAKAVVEMHGGTISAASDGVNRGAAFTVQLATAIAPPPPETGGNGGVEIATPRSRLARILLVEDHPDTARTMKRLLRSSGFEVHTANSVAEALAMAGRESFDLLVSDIGLPDASGYDLMRELRKRQPIKGIALSGYGMEEDVRRSREAGFVEHMVKPVNVAQLEAILHRVIRDG